MRAPACGSDPTHRVSREHRTNELGRWYDCEVCGSTMLVPSPRYQLLILLVRTRRRLLGWLSRCGLWEGGA